MALAFVQWFCCNKEPEEISGMFVVKETDEFEVIELETIEQSLHLIPDFSSIGSTKKSRKQQPQGLDICRKFVINNYGNLEVFNTIY